MLVLVIPAQFDLTDPVQKAAYEKKVKTQMYNYLDYVKKGKPPSAGCVEVFESLNPEQKELWQLKIEKATGKFETPAPKVWLSPRQRI